MNQIKTGLPPNPTISQAAEFFGVDEKTIRRWIAQGRLTAYRVGPRLIRIDRESIIKMCKPIGCAA
ncbi:helix-turn-helix domain-containing protein [Mycobacterium sp.]|uniref:helix-turn-helix domain-containing protein n=1 Tax=Mycobacterium sp. TaxID=1785 RepID=UPI0011FA8183|nr:helix-turn-helix domain-containing protein [Mycobacterium sp.]TAM63551.1 MAG: DNA-binding protein [Mycobacterium sp.]